MTDLPGPPPLPAVSEPLALPPPPKAAWWCWPLIVFALFPFAWFEVAPPADEASPSGSYDPSDLAILKMQGQVVIATSKLDLKAAGDALEDLSGHASDSHSLAALALLESFVQPDSPRLEPLLKRFSDENEDPSGLAEVTRTAVKEGIDETTRGQLRDRLGWFADLARSPGLVPPPQDEAIRLRSYLVLGSMGLLFTAVLIGIATGAILLFLHWRRVRADPGVNAFDPTVGPAGVLFECFALYLGIMTLGSLLGAFLNGVISPISYGLAVIVPLLWPRFRGVRWHEFRPAVGLHRGQGWGKEILAGMIGYLGVLAIASVGISLTLLLTLVAGYFQGEGGAILPGGGTGASPPIGPEAHPLVGWIYEGNFWTRLSCLGLAAGFAPFFEELFFRGALHRYFRRRYRFVASAVFTGLIFAALHPQGFFAIPALAGIGIGFSLLREWRDSLVAPIVAHAINNGTLVLMLWWVL